MKNSNHIYTSIYLLFFFSLTLIGCGSSTSSDTSNADTAVSLSATVVDPYIEGAKFCIDTNRNKSCDTGETLSSASSSTGAITFSVTEALPANTMITADTNNMGTHNGVDYTLGMSAIVGADADGFIISPMTTLQGNTADTSGGDIVTALTDANIVSILQAAGLTDVTLADITADPMENIGALSGTVTDAELARIQASLVLYGFTLVFNESTALKALTPSEVLASGLDTTGSTSQDGVYQVLSAMVTAIKSIVNPTLIANAQTPITAANGALSGVGVSLPDVSAEVIVKTGVAVINRVAIDAATACNNGGGDYTAGLTEATRLLGLTEFTTTVANMGMSYYAAHNKAAFQTVLTATGSANMSDLIGATNGSLLDLGIDCAKSHFIVAADMTYSCVQ